jgi:hypothetical protein
MSHDEELEESSSHEDRFLKTLFAIFLCRIADDDGSEDLLSLSQMHIKKRDEVALTAQQRRRRKTALVARGYSLLLVL